VALNTIKIEENKSKKFNLEILMKKRISMKMTLMRTKANKLPVYKFRVLQRSNPLHR